MAFEKFIQYSMVNMTLYNVFGSHEFWTLTYKINEEKIEN